MTALLLMAADGDEGHKQVRLSVRGKPKQEACYILGILGLN